MNVDVEYAYHLLDRIRKNLTNSVSKTYQRRYGEIFITEQGEIVLSCAFCEKKSGECDPFLAHILEHYYAHKASEAKENEKSASISSESDEEHKPTCEIAIPKTDEQPPEKESLPLEHNTADSTAETSDSSRAATPELPPVKKPRIRNKHMYRCKTCSFTCKLAGNMRVHCRRHVGDKQFTCELCSKKFITTTELNTHMRRHRGDRPFVCAYCGQSFFTHGTLSLHELRHNDYRAYKCEICEKSFYDSTRLKMHAQVHKQERDHVCNTCGAAFSRRSTLREHTKLHVNARQYACDLCEMAFNQKPALLLHRRNKHKLVRGGVLQNPNE